MKLSGYTNPCLEFQYTYDNDIVSIALFPYVCVCVCVCVCWGGGRHVTGNLRLHEIFVVTA